MSEKVIEIAKEASRNGILAFVAFLLTEGVINTVMFELAGNRLTAETVFLIAGFITFILRGIEKQLHKSGSKYQLPV